MAEWKIETYTLAHPITVGEGSDSKTVTEVAMKEPDADAMETIQDSGMLDGGKNRQLKIRDMKVCISALSGLPMTTVGKLHVSDLTQLGELIGPLLSGSVKEPAASAK